MPLLKWLFKSLLILAVFVPFAMAFPLAAVGLCHSSTGAQVVFWAGPWSCAFWALIVSQVVGSKAWRGAEAVRQWRAANGGFGHTIPRACGWMFGGLFLSYAAELAVLILTRSPALLPLGTYAPVLLAVVWCSRG